MNLPPSYLELIVSNKNFRHLWLGQTVSLLGDWFNFVATAGLLAYLTKSGMAIGGLFVVRWLSTFFVSPLAGPLVDRFNRKYLLIFTDLVRALVVLGFLVVKEPSQVWLLYTLTALQMGFTGIFFPTRNAIMPALVKPEALGTANALSSSTWSVMLALGTAIGGLVAGTLGVKAAYLIDSCTFVLSAWILSRISYDKDLDVGTEKKKFRPFKLYVEGLSFLKKDRSILALVLLKPTYFLLAAGAMAVLKVVIGEEVFVIGEKGSLSVGLIFAIMGVGTGTGPLVIRYFVKDHILSLRYFISLGFLLTSLGIGITSTLLSFSIVLVGILVLGLGGGIIWVFSTLLLMQAVPAEVRGRIFSTEYAFFTLMSAASGALTGWFVDLPGVSIGEFMRVLSGLLFLPAILWLLYNLKKYPLQKKPV